ncbi:MAG TPA: hypothetical protein VN478_04090 [Clostridia bacterium]|nr:hypothetical protein [Clostridia bacterium]
MKRILLVLVIVACSMFAGCAALQEPIMPTVTVASRNVPVRLGTYGWRSPGQGIQSDAPVPDEFVVDVQAVSAPCGSSVSVDYGRRPGDLFAYVWNDHEPTRVEIQGGTFTLPLDPGTYIYSLESTWREGHASHVIKLEAIPR